jgi:hypothetical protein
MNTDKETECERCHKRPPYCRCRNERASAAMRKTETVRMKIEFVENTQPGWSRSSVLYYISVLADEDLATVWQFAHELVRANRQKRGPAPPRTGP